MTTTHPGEVSRLDIRVNPRNGNFEPDDPDYIQGQMEDQDELKQALVERMHKGLEDGTFSMETGSGEIIREIDILFTAQRMAQKAMTIRATLPTMIASWLAGRSALRVNTQSENREASLLR